MATEWIERYLSSAKQLSALDTTNTAWQGEVAFGYHNLGALAYESGYIDTAQQHFERGLAQLEHLQSVSGELIYRTEIADALSFLGDIATDRGALTQSLEYHQSSVAAVRDLYDQDPKNTSHQRLLAQYLTVASEAEAVLGNASKAEELVREAVTHYDQLTDIDPSNLWLATSRLNALVKHGYLMLAGRRWEGVERLLPAVLDELGILTNSGHLDRDVHAISTDAHLLRAHMLGMQSDHARALDYLSKAQANLSAMSEKGWENPRWRGKQAQVYLLRAEYQAATQDIAGANQSLAMAGETLNHVQEVSDPHYLLDPLARYLYQRDRSDEARQVVAVLEERKYVPLIPWPAL